MPPASRRSDRPKRTATDAGLNKTGAGVNKKRKGAKKAAERPKNERRERVAKNLSDFIKVIRQADVQIYEPGSDRYERSVTVGNQLFRFSRPGCVVLPTSAADVQKVIKEAKTRDVSIIIKNGGHSYSGSSSATRGILLDLYHMKRVEIDASKMIMTIQGGAQWGHAYNALINGRHDGWIVSGGRCPPVGVSGFVLGGGIGPFTRSIGMGCDSLLEATIITAAGESVTVSRSDDPKSKNGELFWALCGAGGGNFGVVVELKMAILKLANDEVVAGRFTWYPEPKDMDGLLMTMNRFYTADWTDQMTIDSTWLVDLRDAAPMEVAPLGIRFTIYYDGDKRSFDRQIRQHIAHNKLATMHEQRTTAEKSTQFLYESLADQWQDEIERSLPSRKTYSLYSSFVLDAADPGKMQAFSTIVKEELEDFRIQFKGERALASCTLIHSGGKATRKRRSETAFRWRECVYHAYITIDWDDKWSETLMRAFFNTFKERLRPFAMMGRAAFINFPDGTYGAEAHQRRYFGSNRRKLQRIKRTRDPDNYFNWLHGIRPASGPTKRLDRNESNDDDSEGSIEGIHDNDDDDDDVDDAAREPPETMVEEFQDFFNFPLKFPLVETFLGERT